MAPNSREKKFLNALLLIPGLGYHTAVKLHEYFSSYERAFHAGPSELISAGLEQKIKEVIVVKRARIDPNKEMSRMDREGVILVEAYEPGFPAHVREIPSPPQWLYIKGKMAPEEICLAVVGSRKSTSYGREATERIIAGLAGSCGVVIVSGCAMGIDAAAHRAALEQGLRTVAVLGSGLDEASFFPPQNIRLAREIVERGGAVVSEYPLGMPALPQNFIQRNRIIAGLAKGTLVVEAGEKSGALITANFALESGRSVMAVPGSMFSPYSKGTNRLLADGASVVTSAEDIIRELHLPERETIGSIEERLTDSAETPIVENLVEPKSIDELAVSLKTNAPDIISRLSMLELKGLVKNIGGGKWMRV